MIDLQYHSLPPIPTTKEEPTISLSYLIGKKVLFKWDGKPVPQDQFGWYKAEVTHEAEARQVIKEPGM